ncbi:MAG TPA: hypothetical protein VFB58_01675 [Chloroflexota bacterium]|nr:hypothetical protein [Chloroflexota bacterium]
MSPSESGKRSVAWQWIYLALPVTACVLVVVVGIGLASFIRVIDPLFVEVLAIGMLIALGLASAYAVSRGLSARK